MGTLVQRLVRRLLQQRIHHYEGGYQAPEPQYPVLSPAAFDGGYRILSDLSNWEELHRKAYEDSLGSGGKIETRGDRTEQILGCRAENSWKIGNYERRATVRSVAYLWRSQMVQQANFIAHGIDSV